MILTSVISILTSAKMLSWWQTLPSTQYLHNFNWTNVGLVEQFLTWSRRWGAGMCTTLGERTPKYSHCRKTLDYTTFLQCILCHFLHYTSQTCLQKWKYLLFPNRSKYYNANKFLYKNINIFTMQIYPILHYI